jgi:hypothetical protein
VIAATSLFLGVAQEPVAAAVVSHYLYVPQNTPSGFGEATLGTYVGPSTFSLTNESTGSTTIDLTTGFTLSGPGANDYVAQPEASCLVSGNILTLAALGAPGNSCAIDMYFFPGAIGDRNATLTITDTSNESTNVALTGQGGIGYYQVDEFGDVAKYGDAAWYGDTGNDNLNSPIVGMATTGDDGGYWLAAADGGIFSFGPSAGFFGSAGGIHLNKPIVGMAATSDAGGYWMVATDGGIFSYGDAQFYGSTGGMTLNKPIVGMAVDPATGGYWLVAADGGIFAYNAPFYGSTGSLHLNKPIVGMVAAPKGNGYWLVASDGGIFAYGPGASFYGSAGSLPLIQPITSMAAVPDGSGYWFSAADGGLFSYSAPFYGSGTDDPNLDVVVDMATDGSAPLQTLSNSPAIRSHVAETVPAALHVPRYAGPSQTAP